jgi:molecular chaperone DnaK
MPAYWLGIDLGTTSTAAAICRPAAGGLEVQVVPLSSQSYAMPSVLFLPGDGSLVVGEEAQRRSLTDPYRVVREFKSRMGDEIPLLVGGAPFYAHDLAAEFVSSLCQHVTQQEGEPPQAVALTCPASWGPDKTALFERAVQHTGVPNVTTLTEPQAAAIGYAGRADLPPGATVAVYDLGAARFDVAVLRQDAQDRFDPLSRPEGIAGLGGLSFDEVIFEYVCAAAGVPLEEMDPSDHGLAAEVAQLRRECAEAKETLSASNDVIISVTVGGTQHWVRLTRAEFEEMIRPDLDRTIEAMHRAFGSANVVAADLDAILLTGGSARIPLVSQLIAAEFGRPPLVDADPKVAVAAGAARFAAPAGSPVRDLGTLAAVGAAGERRSGPSALLRHPSRKALLGAAALAVLVVGGAATALGTPVLSDLTSHHGNGGGTAASGGAPSTSGSGSPKPSAQSSATPTSKATGTKSAATRNGPVAAGPSSVAAAAAQSSNPVTSPSKTAKASPTKAPVKTKAPTPTRTSAKPSPSPSTSSPTPSPSPSTSSPAPSPSSSSTASVPPAASADPSSATPSMSATTST